MSGGPQYPNYPSYPGDDNSGGHPSDPASWPPAPQPAGSEPGAQHWPTGPSQATATRPAGWWIRVLAAFLDGFIGWGLALAPLVIGGIIAFADSTYDEVTEEIYGVNALGIVIMGVGILVAAFFDVWNRGLRVGYRGQSLGKQATGVYIVTAGGNYLGALEGFFRWLIAQLLQWSCIGLLLDLLWPLWDQHKQTIHDKAVSSYPVVRR